MLKLRPRTRATEGHRPRSQPPAEPPVRPDGPTPDEVEPPAKHETLSRIGVGWKLTSGAIATIATAIGVLATFGVVGGGPGAPPAAVAIASAATKSSDSGSSK